jgi:hypothetical protein
VLRSRARGGLARLEEATGLTLDELTADWHASIPAGEPERRLDGAVSIGGDDPRTRIHVAPAISPDGDRVMFIRSAIGSRSTSSWPRRPRGA